MAVDIQGSEDEVVRSAIGVLRSTTKVLVVGTHSDTIYHGLCSFLMEFGFSCLAEEYWKPDVDGTLVMINDTLPNL